MKAIQNILLAAIFLIIPAHVLSFGSGTGVCYPPACEAGGSGDMLKSTYDTNLDGVCDRSTSALNIDSTPGGNLTIWESGDSLFFNPGEAAAYFAPLFLTDAGVFTIQFNTGYLGGGETVTLSSPSANTMELSDAGGGLDTLVLDEIDLYARGVYTDPVSEPSLSLSDDDTTGDIVVAGFSSDATDTTPGAEYSEVEMVLRENGNLVSFLTADSNGVVLAIQSGTDPTSCIKVGQLYMDTDTSSDTNCTTDQDGALCVCKTVGTPGQWVSFTKYP